MFSLSSMLFSNPQSLCGLVYTDALFWSDLQSYLVLDVETNKVQTFRKLCVCLLCGL